MPVCYPKYAGISRKTGFSGVFWTGGKRQIPKLDKWEMMVFFIPCLPQGWQNPLT